MTATGRSSRARPSLDATRVTVIGREHFGLEPSEATRLPGAAVAVAGTRAIALVSQPTMTVVGGVLLWALHAGARVEAIVVDGDAGPVDRWLEGFRDRPSVSALDGRRLVAPIEPAVERSGPPPAVPAVFEDADVEVVVEHGIVRAEIAGLEVARVVVTPDGQELIEVGVGQYDRAAHRVTTSDQPVELTLARVAAEVRAARRPGAGAHSLSRLCRERWLRSVLVSDPASVGLRELQPVDPLPPRASLLDAVPAPAVGRDGDGTVLVMASVGADPGLAAATAAVAGREQPDRVVVAVPRRDQLVPIQRLLRTLRWPVEMIGVEPPWAEAETADASGADRI